MSWYNPENTLQVGVGVSILTLIIICKVHIRGFGVVKQ